jgi:hypothetical protein
MLRSRESLARWIGEVTGTTARYEKPALKLATAAINDLWESKIPNGMRRGAIYAQINEEASKIEGRKLKIDRKTMKVALDASGKI